MNKQLDYTLAALRRSCDNSYPWSVTPAEAGLLVAEVERLRSINDDYLLEMGRQHALLRDQAREAKTERAAVTARLREQALQSHPDAAGWFALNHVSVMIERGEHRREETK